MNVLADYAAVFTCIKGFNTAIIREPQMMCTWRGELSTVHSRWIQKRFDVTPKPAVGIISRALGKEPNSNEGDNILMSYQL